jgi:hypothetical protein
LNARICGCTNRLLRPKGSVHVLQRRGEGPGHSPGRQSSEMVGLDLDGTGRLVRTELGLGARRATILALDGWPNWRKAWVRARYIDTEYAPPMSFRGGIALVIAVSLLANTLLCALAFALGRGLALWWS